MLSIKERYFDCCTLYATTTKSMEVSTRTLGSSTRSRAKSVRRQGIFWVGTIPHADWVPHPTPGTSWTKCQLELGESGYLHWQCIFAFSDKQSLAGVKTFLPTRGHYELSRSADADDYVWKELTRVGNHQYEFGAKPFQRNQRVEWESVWVSLAPYT